MTMSTSSPSCATVTLKELVEASDHNRHSLQQALTAMMTASMQDLPTQISINQVASVANIPFHQFQLDSRALAASNVFVLLKSHTPNCQKSRDYLYQAANNAAFILSEIDPVALLTTANMPTDAPLALTTDTLQTSVQQQMIALPCPILYVPDIRDFLGDLIQARLQYQQPTTLPTVVAVTGTNGKTTISQLVAQLTQLTGMSSAVMGTAGNGRLGSLVQASHTTGDALAVQQFLYQMGQEGAELLALEASSHGLDQQRLQGMPVSVAIYTNLSRDHLDYHADMTEYAAAKAKLFDRVHFPDLTHAIINIDDEYAQVMLDTAHASDLIVWTYSLDATKMATFVATDIKPSLQGVEITLRSNFSDTDISDTDISGDKGGNITIVSPLLGRFNVANLLAAIAATVAIGSDVDSDFNSDIERIAAAVPKLQGAIGRMQRVPSAEGCFIVDYAHTPDALSQVLASLKTHCKGQLWAVFGCGGDRDAGKRPLMAQAGLAGADQVILTADNPRTEDPNAILQDMQAGMSAEQYQRTHIEPARQTAIEYAVSQASADDIIVIAGKGHETYQEINHVRYDFDDSIVLQNALKQAGRA
ncbi:UDP-N-acetylmuramoyl-L-alanyl-D-glutamate--2,6-diaminopimelate ligase [Psychrobacter aquaticus]|uniref:UDP-N-acetylmuramoyl-L-alanyl-D-glutamate--2,6-diaminopimelate ligase n=1 Tax=Psychrobacter aquaticus CMS 56 TaxID=1354303 RepID=U4TEW4_9GAMM|nr:UDP-N-acetylmuramoyl-L-alanyl-D-glutamate--2,6-diaminopimelate ligase [Psychrobacter aquaticus]ERL57008.1 UDP-N-acetylmuramoylalanyl-D-glutamate--2,6- diaminopimelate ligase [Psychrobacter aquaticus CMS 56]